MVVTLNLLLLMFAILVCQITVLVWAVKADIRHDKATGYGTPERERAKWWEGIQMGTLVMFLLTFVLWLIGLIAFALESVPEYNRETEMKCKTIEGEFSRRLDACYKEGVKINFNDGEMTYGE